MIRKAPSSRPRRQPSYRLHKARGCAVVTIDGKNHYLGKYDSRESHEKYARLIARWQANGRVTSSDISEETCCRLTVSELILQYLEHAEVYYKDYGDKHHGEISNFRYALRPLRIRYGCTLSKDFSPEALENVQQRMIEEGLARTTINGRIMRIKRAFRWAARKGLVSPSVYHGLRTVEGLKRGRSAAKESEPVKPVPEAEIQATCLHLNPHVKAMVQVQELLGMRPQDVRNMRTCDIDRIGDVWVYEPHTHKNEHHGNPPANRELLAVLQRELVESDFDLKHIYRLILNSSAYQQSCIPATDHPEAVLHFAHYPIRRLDAEVLIDAVCQITGTTESYSSLIPEPWTFIPGSERSICLADGSITSPFVELFGRPARSTGYESERGTSPNSRARVGTPNTRLSAAASSLSPASHSFRAALIRFSGPSVLSVITIPLHIRREQVATRRLPKGSYSEHASVSEYVLHPRQLPVTAERRSCCKNSDVGGRRIS